MDNNIFLKINNNCDDVKKIIFDYILLSDKSQLNKKYFKDYSVKKYINLFNKIDINTYVRNIIRIDAIFILRSLMENMDSSLKNKRMVYRKKRMILFEYMINLCYNYSSDRCRWYLMRIYEIIS
tara:strand:- start:181 stop:552 length:372 start_codon:yes stop_codon:yes gene_type:complete